jgi:hypothetical protein
MLWRVPALVCRDARWHIFKPNILNLGKFWRVLQRKMLVFRPFGILYGSSVYFVVIWYVVPVVVNCTT